MKITIESTENNEYLAKKIIIKLMVLGNILGENKKNVNNQENWRGINYDK